MERLIENYILLFFIYSFVGWILEIIVCSIAQKKFVNRGFLIGPVCPIYGFGSLAITILLKGYIDQPITLFIMAVLVCGILEYMTSWAMEKIFKARWWDYTHKKFNINGRISLDNLVCFGILGILISYVLNPFLISHLDQISIGVIRAISIILCIIFALDVTVSFNVISKVRITTKNVSKVMRKDSTNEITRRVREVLSKEYFLGKRLMDAFPNLKTVRKKVKVKIVESKEKLEERREKLEKELEEIKKRISK